MDYIDWWLENAEATIDAVTYEGYKSNIVNHIRPYFSNLNLTLQGIKVSDIEKYYANKATTGRLDGKAGGLSHRTIELHKAALSRMFGDAMR